MDISKHAIAKKIEELGRRDFKRPWHQRIEMSGVWTRDHSPSSPRTWKKLKKLLPSDMSNKIVLDLGCNAGMFCVEFARLGCTVFGYEPKESWYKQALFVREYFRQVEEIDYGLWNIGLEQIEELDIELTHIDYLVVLAVLRLIPKRIRLNPLRYVLSKTSNIILRETELGYWQGFFEGAGFNWIKSSKIYDSSLDGSRIHLFSRP